MTYNYKIGYYTHEESDYLELQHEEKFSDEELTEMIAEAVVDTIKKVKEDEDKYRCYLHSFEDIFETTDFEDDNSQRCVVQYLIYKFGFKYIEYERCWNIFGWGSVFDKDSWKDERGDHLDKITEAVNKAGFTREDDVFLQDEERRKGSI